MKTIVTRLRERRAAFVNEVLEEVNDLQELRDEMENVTDILVMTGRIHHILIAAQRTVYRFNAEISRHEAGRISDKLPGWDQSDRLPSYGDSWLSGYGDSVPACTMCDAPMEDHNPDDTGDICWACFDRGY